jgi:FkbM family methyltransferase
MDNKKINLNFYESYIWVKTIDDQYIFINSNDKFIGKELELNGFWEDHVRDVLKTYLKPGMVAIDVGANIGAHTLLMSKLVGKEGKVIAFEPSIIHYNSLLSTLMINKCINTTLYKYGVGEKEEIMYVDKKWFNTEQKQNFGALYLETKRNNDEDEEIIVKSLDSFNFDKVDIVKIDAESMEDKVFFGMKNIIEKFRPIIIVEIHDEDYIKMEKIITSLNYELFAIFSKIYNSRTWDFLAIPK